MGRWWGTTRSYENLDKESVDAANGLLDITLTVFIAGGSRSLWDRQSNVDRVVATVDGAVQPGVSVTRW